LCSPSNTGRAGKLNQNVSSWCQSAGSGGWDDGAMAWWWRRIGPWGCILRERRFTSPVF